MPTELMFVSFYAKVEMFEKNFTPFFEKFSDRKFYF